MSRRGNRDSDGHVEFNPRQRQVLNQIAKGAPDRDIVEMFLIAPATVAAHRETLLERTALRNRIELVVWAAERDECCVHRTPEE